jgi:DNA-binding GntR family transcriptional regulator
MTGVRREPLKRRLLQPEAVRVLREMIIFGELAPGEVLPEEQIGSRLGVSRTPLREALKILAAEGLVKLRPHHRARVSGLSIREVQELFEVLSELEGIAARMAAARIKPTQISRLEKLQARMEACFNSGRLKEYFAVNQEIHRVIVEAAGNVVLRETHALLLARAERARFLALQTPQRWDDSLREHRELLESLKERDGNKASLLLSTHVRRTGEVIGTRISNEAAVEPEMSIVTTKKTESP